MLLLAIIDDTKTFLVLQQGLTSILEAADSVSFVIPHESIAFLSSEVLEVLIVGLL